jgi:FtsH-binding integral membrane protein
MSGAVANASGDVRAAFIRKVYGLFFTSVLVMVGVGVFCAQPAVATTIMGLFMPILIVDFVLGIAVAFARRTTGLNVALLYLFAAVQGAIMGPLLILLNRAVPGVPLEAAVLTCAVFGGLTLYALQSGKDFSFLGGMLFAALIALLVGGIVMFFVHSPLISMFYSVAGVLIFSGYVLYDTSNIMRRLGPDEAIAGAISLYLDFINLFWYILRLLMELNRRN